MPHNFRDQGSQAKNIASGQFGDFGNEPDRDDQATGNGPYSSVVGRKCVSRRKPLPFGWITATLKV